MIDESQFTHNTSFLSSHNALLRRHLMYETCVSSKPPSWLASVRPVLAAAPKGP